jgi:hypothetical protein
VIVLAALLGACAELSLRSEAAPDTVYGRQILLTLPQDVAAAAALNGDPNRRYLRRRAYGPPPVIDATLDELASRHGLKRVEGWPIASLGVYCEVFRVPESMEIDNVIGVLLADPRVDLVQPMNTFETLVSRYDDPYADLQPAMSQLGIEQAHRLATGKGVTVAVIDSAIDASHPDLDGHVEFSRDLIGAGPASIEGEIHGTAVAGVIASTANNKVGIVGVAPDVSIAALRACWSVDSLGSRARCSSFSLAQALEIALGIEPAVINLSLGGPHDPLLARLLAQAMRRGIVVVTADSGADGESFPASMPGVIVARGSPVLANGSRGHAFVAPASEILTTIPNSGYAFLSGTSLAAAHVSGVIALILERDASIGAERIAQLLADTMSFSLDGSSISACGALQRLTDTQICAVGADVASYSDLAND